MDDLRQIAKHRRPQVQQLLALQIPLAALARHRGHQGRSMLGQRRALVRSEFPRMHRLPLTTGHNPHPVSIEVQRRWHADGFGRHRVAVPIVQHGSCGTHIDGDAQGQVFRPNFQGTQSRRLLSQTHGGDDSGRPAGKLLIYFPMPLHKLLLQIFLIMEGPHFEERRLHVSHQILYRSFLPRLVGPTQLHSQAHLQRGVGEDRIPFRHFPVLLPFQSDSLRSIEHAEQRTSAPTLKMLGQRAHQALHGLVRHQTDADRPGVLQARGKEMDATGGSVDELHGVLPKIVLAEFSRQSFETDQRLHRFRAKRSDQAV